ncbi:DUF6691 family protein [Xylophilus sp.]|uniref:DUF6691 family protein n=1 Tax=Xylophilus sp. TaxID=2653893 RepID=UPI0013BA7B82|nr:DUF6691 family protein [Xylophilus sp.]KAF1046282.1 MAG: hypothetical protein GAK38_02522 [Xylophilus sp.]
MSRVVQRSVAALLSGTVFGLGLSIAQMTDPRKVLGFLDVAGAWDASLLLVLGGAVAVAAAGFAWVLRRRAPVLDDDFQLPARGAAIDAPLLGGAALFGIGWGLAGYCPGPALASIAFGNAEALWFVPALAAGWALRRWQERRRSAAGGGSG